MNGFDGATATGPPAGGMLRSLTGIRLHGTLPAAGVGML
jgi:hypothetical protein